MLRFWLSRDASIPIREQLGAQLILGILSRRIAPGDRLPSVRDLARRLKVHSNTVSAAYRDLAARGWVSQRRGSGVYVRELKMPEPSGGVDGFVRAWVEDGAARGYDIDAVEAALSKLATELRAPSSGQNLLVLHSDRHLARILAAEIEEATGQPVAFGAIADANQHLTSDSLVLSTASCERAVSELRPNHQKVIRLKSMEEVFAGQHRPTPAALIAVVSRSESIRQWSSMLLGVVGITGMAILQRNPDEPGWKDGLAACDIVAADVIAARELPKKIRASIFRIISNDFLDEMRQLVTAQKV
jgi:GntR family transcriptional regulator